MYGDTALVRGYAAWFLAQLLERQAGGLDALLARSGMPLAKGDNVLRAHTALGHAGGLWRISTSGSGGNWWGGNGADSTRALSTLDQLSPREVASWDHRPPHSVARLLPSAEVLEPSACPTA